jgi:hypothetical protein
MAEVNRVKKRSSPVDSTRAAREFFEEFPNQPTIKMQGRIIEFTRDEMVQLVEWAEANEITSLPIAVRTLALAALSAAPGWKVYHLKKKAWMRNVKSTLLADIARFLHQKEDELRAGIELDEAQVPPEAIQYVVDPNDGGTA